MDLDERSCRSNNKSWYLWNTRNSYYGHSDRNNGWGGIFADLWRYDISTNEWTWMKGPAGPTTNPGTYGTQGIPTMGTQIGIMDGAASLLIFGDMIFQPMNGLG